MKTMRLTEAKWSAVICLHLAGQQWNGHWVHDASSRAQKSSCSLLLPSSFHHDVSIESCRIHFDATGAANDLAALTRPFHQTSAKADFHYMHFPCVQTLLKFMLVNACSTYLSVCRKWTLACPSCMLPAEGEQSNSCLLWVCAHAGNKCPFWSVFSDTFSFFSLPGGFAV